MKYTRSGQFETNQVFAPSRGRELKLKMAEPKTNPAPVRPLAGAGIEMELRLAHLHPPRPVRPLAGAGIEIGYVIWHWKYPAFAPSRGRELK